MSTVHTPRLVRCVLPAALLACSLGGSGCTKRVVAERGLFTPTQAPRSDRVPLFDETGDLIEGQTRH